MVVLWTRAHARAGRAELPLRRVAHPPRRADPLVPPPAHGGGTRALGAVEPGPGRRAGHRVRHRRPRRAPGQRREGRHRRRRRRAAAEPRPGHDAAAAAGPVSVGDAPCPPLPRRVAIVGDSQATALVRNAPSGLGQYLRVSNGAVEGCGLVDSGSIVTRARFRRDFDNCDGWEQDWARSAAGNDVTLVVIGAWDVFDVRRDGTRVAFGSAQDDQYLSAQLAPRHRRDHGRRQQGGAARGAVLPQRRRRRPGGAARAQRRPAHRPPQHLLRAAAADDPEHVVFVAGPQRVVHRSGRSPPTSATAGTASTTTGRAPSSCSTRSRRRCSKIPVYTARQAASTGPARHERLGAEGHERLLLVFEDVGVDLVEAMSAGRSCRSSSVSSGCPVMTLVHMLSAMTVPPFTLHEDRSFFRYVTSVTLGSPFAASAFGSTPSEPGSLSTRRCGAGGRRRRLRCRRGSSRRGARCRPSSCGGVRGRQRRQRRHRTSSRRVDRRRQRPAASPSSWTPTPPPATRGSCRPRPATRSSLIDSDYTPTGTQQPGQRRHAAVHLRGHGSGHDLVGVRLRAAMGDGRRAGEDGDVPRQGRVIMSRWRASDVHEPVPPIAEYAFLSDCTTGALVAPNGQHRVALPAPLRLPERLRRRSSTAVPASSAWPRTASTCPCPAATCRAR